MFCVSRATCGLRTVGCICRDVLCVACNMWPADCWLDLSGCSVCRVQHVACGLWVGFVGMFCVSRATCGPRTVGWVCRDVLCVACDMWPADCGLGLSGCSVCRVRHVACGLWVGFVGMFYIRGLHPILAQAPCCSGRKMRGPRARLTKYIVHTVAGHNH
jgi:hypothetical protein